MVIGIGETRSGRWEMKTMMRERWIDEDELIDFTYKLKPATSGPV